MWLLVIPVLHISRYVYFIINYDFIILTVFLLFIPFHISCYIWWINKQKKNVRRVVDWQLKSHLEELHTYMQYFMINQSTKSPYVETATKNIYFIKLYDFFYFCFNFNELISEQSSPTLSIILKICMFMKKEKHFFLFIYKFISTTFCIYATICVGNVYIWVKSVQKMVS